MAAPGSGHDVRVVVAADRLSATLCVGPGSRDGIEPILIDALLDERGVARTHDRAALVRAALDALATSDPAAEFRFVVARGTEAAAGEDGRFEPAAPLSPEIQPTSEGAIDHHARSAYTVVRAGQVLGRLIAPTAGVDGVDVTGHSIAAKPGKPAPIVLDHTCAADAGGVVRALVSGALILSDGRIRVKPDLEVAGFVDFTTGNIDFPGSVHVGRGVRDCFVVRAGEDLVVRGLVEAATLRAGRDADLAGGMAGREQGSLHAGRDLKAAYLDATATTAGRDLFVMKEITGSRVEVRRNVHGPTCAIIGGHLTVAGECEVAQLGSEAGTATRVDLGCLPPLESLAASLAEAFPLAEEAAASASRRLTSLKQASGRLTPQQAEELTTLEFELGLARERLKKVTSARLRVLTALDRFTTVKLTVHRALYPGVRLHIGRVIASPREMVRGPMTIVLSAAGEPLMSRGPRTEPLSACFRLMPNAEAPDLLGMRRAVGLAA